MTVYLQISLSWYIHSPWKIKALSQVRICRPSPPQKWPSSHKRCVMCWNECFPLLSYWHPKGYKKCAKKQNFLQKWPNLLEVNTKLGNNWKWIIYIHEQAVFLEGKSFGLTGSNYTGKVYLGIPEGFIAWVWPEILFGVFLHWSISFHRSCHRLNTYN